MVKIEWDAIDPETQSLFKEAYIASFGGLNEEPFGFEFQHTIYAGEFYTIQVAVDHDWIEEADIHRKKNWLQKGNRFSQDECWVAYYAVVINEGEFPVHIILCKRGDTEVLTFKGPWWGLKE